MRTGSEKRIGAILGASTEEVYFLGYGVYLGHEIPPAEIGGFNFGLPNPKLQLDNGDIVYGCECWWGSEEQMRKKIKSFAVVTHVRIADYRNRGKK